MEGARTNSHKLFSDHDICIRKPLLKINKWIGILKKHSKNISYF